MEDFWKVAKIALGVGCILLGLLRQEFTPLGLTTELVWGKQGRIPRWVAGPFYILMRILILDLALTGK